MNPFVSQKKEPVVEGMTADRLESADVARFGTLTAVEDRSGAYVGGKAALRGSLRIALAQCTPANVPGVVSGSCFGMGTIEPSGRTALGAGLALLRVGDVGTCTGSCLVQVGSATVSKPQTCRVTIAKSGQQAGGAEAAPVAASPPARSALQRSRSYRVRLSVCAVSWIDQLFLPSADGIEGAPVVSEAKTRWFARTLYGLYCTWNPVPPAILKDPDRDWLGLGLFPQAPSPEIDVEAFRERKEKEYRWMLYASLGVEIDPRKDRIVRVHQGRQFVDRGWTRPFRKDSCPLGYFAPAVTLSWDTYDTTSYPGEHSNVSGFHYHRRHPNSALAIDPDEQPVVSGLMKARAGKHTDDIGLSAVRTPFHVPWVWSELLVAYRHGEFHLHGLGSAFPSHTWYVNGRRVALQPQVCDPAIFRHPRTGDIDLEKMQLYRVFKQGAPADQPQAHPLETDPDAPVPDRSTGPVTGHAYTAPAGKPVVHTWPAG